MTPRIARALAPFAALALAACGIVPEAQTLNVYQLPPSTVARSTEPPLAVGIRIATPEAGELTGGSRILVMRQDNEVSLYQASRWVDPAALLLRNRIAEAFRSDGRFRTVTTDSINVPAEVELRGELATFQVEYSGGRPSVKIRFHALLAFPQKAAGSATRLFEVTQPVEGDKVPQVVQAFGAAADRLAAEIVAWAAERSR